MLIFHSYVSLPEGTYLREDVQRFETGLSLDMFVEALWTQRGENGQRFGHVSCASFCLLRKLLREAM